MDNILLIGSSGHAKVVLDVVEKEAKYQIIGFLDPFRKIGETTLGYPVLGKEEDLFKLRSEYQIKGIIVAIGDNFLRAKVANRLRTIDGDLPFISSIHPSAVIGKNVKIGVGTVIMAGVVVNPDSKIGNFCIVNTKASLDHDSVMEDFSSLAPGVTTGGNCSLGQFSVLSLGCSVIHGVQIGEHTVIGAGSVVLKTLGPLVLAYGCPAKVIRSRVPGEKYL